jgi:hypothetical protein
MAWDVGGGGWGGRGGGGVSMSSEYLNEEFGVWGGGQTVN